MAHVGKKYYFPWQHLDTKRWPGRELLWIWCHPGLSVLILFSVIMSVVLYLGADA